MSPCPAQTAKGKPCRAPLVKGGRYCFFHDPEKAEARAAAQANGGAESRNRVGPTKTLGAKAPAVDVTTEGKVRELVQETIDQVRRGELSSNAGNVVGQLLSVALRALKQDELHKKVQDLEARFRPLEGIKPEVLEEIVRLGRASPVPEGDPAH